MAAGRGRRPTARRSRERPRRAVAAGGGAALLLLLVAWSAARPYVLGAAVLAGLGVAGWWLWRTDRAVRGADRGWRQAEAVRAGHRTLAEIDTMSGTEFEELVAALCRRDGCTEVRRVGGSHDNGADVTGRLPDGRTMVVQCKRYAPRGAIASREVRDLLGARVHFGAEVAVFVTTTRFSRPSEAFVVKHGILAVHRDHLGLWNNGASLQSLLGVNGSGQGDRRHRTRWKKTYGT
ncbi:restriction endonuclease [Streptomyces carminius]|uniref:Restriction endonuclease n=1 Tax=Streptomyces carminius TaxID=2665496 RepID=A0A2M8M110_9ACTN|nr:restriction endonuclease [Streptomyces carminius]PJE97893.1 restriction endonuclease [Streptomyces carminius]PJF01720.1 restriction endonuclease [Streptomyces carminius]